MGDIVAIGSAYGKVRAMMDDKGRRVKEAGPSTPVLNQNTVIQLRATLIIKDMMMEINGVLLSPNARRIAAQRLYAIVVASPPKIM